MGLKGRKRSPEGNAGRHAVPDVCLESDARQTLSHRGLLFEAAGAPVEIRKSTYPAKRKNEAVQEDQRKDE